MYGRNISGFSIIMAETISANVCGELIYQGQLSSNSHNLGSFIYSVIDGEDASDIELNALDKLLTKNNPDLKGVIFEEYNEAVAFRAKQRACDESEARACDPDYLAEQYEKHFLSEFDPEYNQ